MSKIQGTLAQWRDRLRRKELSPAELVNLTADAIEADRTTNAYISFDREAALHAAAGADISSPLAGLPAMSIPCGTVRESGMELPVGFQLSLIHI